VRKISLVIAAVIILVAAKSARPAFSAPPLQATIAQSIFIQSPREGQALQGVEIIEGKIRGEGFVIGKISFSYANVEDPTWFFIADIEPENSDSSQTSFKYDWDTNQITDGDYNIRVVAEYQSGPIIYELIPDIRVRNHSPVETSTPAPLIEENSTDIQPTFTFEVIPEDTITPLPGNPVVIKSEGLSRVMWGSALFVMGVFLIGGIYWFIINRD
jgi:hypothetical protein